jgi:hypothetical protein
MNTKTQEALEMAIEALDSCDIAEGMSGPYQFYDAKLIDKAIQACKEALAQPAITDEKGRPMTYWGGLAQPAQEPVAWVSPKTAYYFGITNKYETGVFRYGLFDDATIPLYIHPAPSWQGLSNDEIGRLSVFDGLHHVEVPLLAKFIRAIEQALKEKNT